MMSTTLGDFFVTPAATVFTCGTASLDAIKASQPLTVFVREFLRAECIWVWLGRSVWQDLALFRHVP